MLYLIMVLIIVKSNKSASEEQQKCEWIVSKVWEVVIKQITA